MEKCKGSFHAKCVNLSKEILQHVLAPGIKWYCPSCRIEDEMDEEQNEDFSAVKILREDKSEIYSNIVLELRNVIENLKAETVPASTSSSTVPAGGEYHTRSGRRIKIPDRYQCGK